MCSNGTESLMFDTFSKFKQWKETLKTDRGLQFTFQWSRVQNGSQYWRYTCKHVRLTNTHPHKFAYMMVAIEVDGRVQVELNAPNINQDLYEDARSPLKDAESSEPEKPGEAETDRNETVESEDSESNADEMADLRELVENHEETAQPAESRAECEKKGQSEESDAEKDETSQEGKTEETPKNDAQLEKSSGANQQETSELKELGPNTEEIDAGNAIEKETDISPLQNVEAETDAQDGTESCPPVEKVRLGGSKTDGTRDNNHKRPVVRHARPWESATAESFDARFDGSIEIAVEADPDLFLRNDETQPEENNSRKKFKNAGGTSDEIIQFSARNIDRVSELDGSEQTR